MIFAEENAGKVEFTLQPGVTSPPFAASAHADKTPSEGQKLCVEAAVVSSTVVSQAGPWGSCAARAALRLRAAPSICKAPQPEPCSSPAMV